MRPTASARPGLWTKSSITPSQAAPPNSSILGPRPASQISVPVRPARQANEAWRSRTQRPSASTVSPASSRRQASMASVTAASGRFRSIPSGSRVRLPPAPMPRKARPPDSSSSEAMAPAVAPAWRV